MLVNQELRRCGVGVEGGVPFSSELVLAEFDRVSVACFPCSVWLPLVAGAEGGLGTGAGVGTEAGAGEGESRPPELDSDLVRDIAFLATLSGRIHNALAEYCFELFEPSTHFCTTPASLSPPFPQADMPSVGCEPLGFPCVIQLTSRLWICSILLSSRPTRRHATQRLGLQTCE